MRREFEEKAKSKNQNSTLIMKNRLGKLRAKYDTVGQGRENMKKIFQRNGAHIKLGGVFLNQPVCVCVCRLNIYPGTIVLSFFEIRKKYELAVS